MGFPVGYPIGLPPVYISEMNRLLVMNRNAYHSMVCFCELTCLYSRNYFQTSPDVLLHCRDLDGHHHLISNCSPSELKLRVLLLSRIYRNFMRQLFGTYLCLRGIFFSKCPQMVHVKIDVINVFVYPLRNVATYFNQEGLEMKGSERKVTFVYKATHAISPCSYFII